MSVPAETRTPRLVRGVRLHHDAARGAWVLLGPERILQPDAVALEILKRVDGTANVGTIVDDLAESYSAPRGRIDEDVRGLLDGLAEKGFVEYAP